MGTTALIVIMVVVVVVVLLLVLFFASRRRAAQRSEEQRERTREEFGSEYERTAQGDRLRGGEAEEDGERRSRVERRVEPLSENRGRYEEQWGEVERVFVDNPREVHRDGGPDRLRHPERAQLRLRRGPVRRGRPRGAWPPCTLRSLTTTREARRIRADVVAHSAGRAEVDSSEQSTEEMRQAVHKYGSVYQRLVRE